MMWKEEVPSSNGEWVRRARSAAQPDAGYGQLAADFSFAEVVLKVLFACWPTVLIEIKHTTTINANITAYSTAVGPSSRLRKVTTFRYK
jgi:hypothetical protein